MGGIRRVRAVTPGPFASGCIRRPAATRRRRPASGSLELSHAAFEPRRRPRPDRDPRGAGSGPTARTWCRCATRAWRSRRSRTTAARPRSWPSTSRPRPGPTSSSRRAATRTSPTSACSRRPSGRLVFDANDFDETLPGTVGVGRQAARGERRHRRPRQRVQRRARTARRRWPPSRRTASGWRGTRRCASSTSGTRHHRGRHPRGRRGAGACAGQGAGSRPAQGSRRCSRRRAARTRCKAAESADHDRRRPPGHPRRSAGHPARRAPGGDGASRRVFDDYRATLAESRREFLERYRFADVALKVVGVGSVGTRCFVIVLEGRDEDDPLILQAKEATASVLEAHLRASEHTTPRRARRRRPAADAGHARHLPRLDPWSAVVATSTSASCGT